MTNLPTVRLGLIATSRNCFPIELARRRRTELIKECRRQKIRVHEISTIVEREDHVIEALKETERANINALVIFLGNFGPEGPETLLAQNFNGPVMFVAAAEESSQDLIHGRGDAYCGLLSACYNLGLRRVKVYLPEYPIGRAPEIASMIQEFIPIARILLGIRNLKIIAFGPRPQDFFTCHAPLQPLYDLGIEVMENSELDLYDAFLKSKDDPAINKVVEEMKVELKGTKPDPSLLKKLAQYEVTLLNFFEMNRGRAQYVVFANKCWPAFEHYFGFVPCYVNSRLASQGIPVACEVDIYGALSEYLAACASNFPVSLLDINNTVPLDMYEKEKEKIGSYKLTDLFMGFHCGNTPACCLVGGELRYQLIMNRLLEAGKEPEITRGTLEGRIKPGPITLFRLQATPENWLQAYLAEGEVLDIDPQTFGGVGVFAIKEMGRFYRYVLLEKQFPHHTAVAFEHIGRPLFSALRVLGIEDINFNQPANLLYPGENPFGSFLS
ncbi:MAG: fucose isomerase [Candidatus Aminicenantes bacterium]|nr:fucose isomerase [Candidatus Aminicenantes bacterium]